MSVLRLSNFRVTRGATEVIKDVNLAIMAGELVGLIGPNGAGKTSLLRAALGLISATGANSLTALERHARAKTVAWMPQERAIHWPILVEDLVALGRLPFGRQQGKTPAARAAIEAAIARTDIAHLRQRPGNALSGGEQARVLLARVLAQETPVIFADEPIAGLDPHHQIATMGLFRDLSQSGKAILISLHDLGLAARFCTRLIMLDHGRIVADGAPRDVLRHDLLAKVFGIEALIDEHEGEMIFQAMRLAGNTI